MFIGHFAVGMAAKKIEPGASLATLFLAAQFLDLIWPTLLLLNIEQVEIQPGISAVTPLDFTNYPVSHSLLIVSLWSGLFALVYFLFTKKTKGALLMGALVLSHWVLDLIVHIPDLPLYPGNSPKWGLGMWNSPLLTILVEGAIFAFGIIVYTRTKMAAKQTISWWFWSLVLFMLLIHIGNLAGPPPPNVEAIAWAGHLQWLFILWAWWADKKSSAIN